MNPSPGGERDRRQFGCEGYSRGGRPSANLRIYHKECHPKAMSGGEALAHSRQTAIPGHTVVTAGRRGFAQGHGLNDSGCLKSQWLFPLTVWHLDGIHSLVLGCRGPHSGEPRPASASIETRVDSWLLVGSSVAPAHTRIAHVGPRQSSVWTQGSGIARLLLGLAGSLTARHGHCDKTCFVRVKEPDAARPNEQLSRVPSMRRDWRETAMPSKGFFCHQDWRPVKTARWMNKEKSY